MKRTPIKPKRRTASEFRRIYGSKERVRRMKMRPCDGCGRVPTEEWPNDNAHTENGGMGRKAGWETVVTLCKPCHYLLDDVWGSVEMFDRVKGVDLRAVARLLSEEVA
jgi:hypothetical protein